jgi:hypothetical protein
MRHVPTLVDRIEWAHRRLEWAKRLIQDGLILRAETTSGPLFLCRSQTRPGTLYVVERDECPCEDAYQVQGRKLCKHILARAILEAGTPLKEIGANPLYWQQRTPRAEVSANGRAAVTKA